MNKRNLFFNDRLPIHVAAKIQSVYKTNLPISALMKLLKYIITM